MPNSIIITRPFWQRKILEYAHTYIYTYNWLHGFPTFKNSKKIFLITYAALEYRYMLLHLLEATVKLYEINLWKLLIFVIKYVLYLYICRSNIQRAAVSFFYSRLLFSHYRSPRCLKINWFRTAVAAVGEFCFCFYFLILCKWGNLSNFLCIDLHVLLLVCYLFVVLLNCDQLFNVVWLALSLTPYIFIKQYFTCHKCFGRHMCD